MLDWSKNATKLALLLDAEEQRRAMLVRVFESDDELANVAVFRWLLSNHLSSVPIEVGYFRVFREEIYSLFPPY